jgi:hypothetical protein
VNVPDRPLRGEIQVVVTTPSYRAGQVAAWRDFDKDPDTQPNRALLARLKDEEFAAGYCDEFNTFIVPARARMPALLDDAETDEGLGA